MPVVKFNCLHVDTCLPDYWQGHHLPHVAIPIFKGMSMKGVKDAIKQELMHGAVMGSTLEANLLGADYVAPEDEKYADTCTKAAYAAVSRIKPEQKWKRKFFTDLENDDSVFAYFVFHLE